MLLLLFILSLYYFHPFSNAVSDASKPPSKDLINVFHQIPKTHNTILIPLLLNKPISMISTTVPSRVQKNSMFIVDLDYLLHPEDILSDDLGAWIQSDTKKKFYLLQKDENDKVLCISRTEQVSNKSRTVERRTYINRSDSALRKTIVNVIDENLIFVHYYFVGREHEIKVKAHKSSRNIIPYLRTYKSTKLSLLNELKEETSIKKALFKTSTSVGNVEKVSNGGALPRGKNQASYIRSQNNEVVKDPIMVITQKIRNYDETSEERFIRSFSLDDSSPKVVAFTDYQIQSIVNFCCNDTGEYNSLLYTDITFQLGPFYLLLITYLNTTLYYKNTERCPVMIGPMMLCMIKDKNTYLTLFQKIVSSIPGIKQYLQGYATDSEAALRNALAHEFPNSLAFICTIHAKKNIRESCTRLGLSSKLTSIILKDIFQPGGLVYASNRTEFMLSYQSCKEKWNQLEAAEKVVPQFVHYFEKNKLEDIYHHMRISVAKEAGLGNQLVTTNPIESINALVKRWTHFQPNDMATFLDEVKRCIDDQTENIKRAFINLDGPYVVRDKFKSSKIDNFFDKTSEEKKRAANKILATPVNKKRYVLHFYLRESVKSKYMLLS